MESSVCIPTIEKCRHKLSVHNLVYPKPKNFRTKFKTYQMIILTNDTWNPNAFRQWIVSFAVLFLTTGVIGCDWGSKEKQVSAPANPNANGEKPASGPRIRMVRKLKRM
jgi:hypothetical protein